MYSRRRGELPGPTAEELSKDLDLDLSGTGEPVEPLADAEISEEQRQDAVRLYKRKLEEKARR